MNTLFRLAVLEAVIYPLAGRGGAFRRGLAAMLILGGLYAMATSGRVAAPGPQFQEGALYTSSGEPR